MSPQSCFLAKDKSYLSLLLNIKKALSASEEKLEATRTTAFNTLRKFTKKNTWQEIESFLKTNYKEGYG